MAKNKKTMKKDAPAPPPASVGLSAGGKALVVAGTACVLVGFFLLRRADPMGAGWAAGASSFFLLGGYAGIGLGLFLPAER